MVRHGTEAVVATVHKEGINSNFKLSFVSLLAVGDIRENLWCHVENQNTIYLGKVADLMKGSSHQYICCPDFTKTL